MNVRSKSWRKRDKKIRPVHRDGRDLRFVYVAYCGSRFGSPDFTSEAVTCSKCVDRFHREFGVVDIGWRR